MSQPPYPQQPPTGPYPPTGQYPPTNAAFQQSPGQPAGPQGSRKAKKVWFKRPIVWILAVIVIIVIAVNSGGDSDSATAEPAATSSTATEPDAQTAEKAAAKASTKAAADAEARAKAEARASEEAKAQKEAAALKDPASYKKLTDRDFALLVKDPDAHKGEKIVVHGYVSQLDAATGPDALRASLGATSKEEWYDYEENAIVNASDKGMFGDVVKDDLVTIYVTVDGSMSYGTQIGGNTTVPKLTAHIIKVTGSGA